jgi:hypothetical protein
MSPEFEDIDIWKDLLDTNFMNDLHLDYSKDNIGNLHYSYDENRRRTIPGI